MIEPLLSDDPLLAEIVTPVPSGLSLWWLGQSGFLVRSPSGCLLLDPYLSESLTNKYAATDKPHVRMTRRPIDAARLSLVDVVTSSHNHTDHLDAETLIPLRAANPKLQMVAPEANRSFVAERLGTPPEWPVGLTDGQSADVAGWRIYALPAAHETIERDERGRCKFLGYVIQAAGLTLYHSGDCIPFPAQVDLLRTFHVDLALLPINGRRPERRVAGNFWGREAAALAREIGARMVIPCHYEMFEFNTEPPDEFVAECERLSQPYHVLRCGERLNLSPA